MADDEVTEPVGEPTTPVPDPMEVITRTNEAAERLEKATANLNAKIAQSEALQVERTLGGAAEAGQPSTHEETPEEYAKKVMANDVETKP